MAKIPARRKSAAPRGRPKAVHQFLIVLSGTDPIVWRRIQVPESYSFWDLHVAIQDAMGWLDYHLHEFRLLDADEKHMVSIGIPTDDDPEDRPVVPGWEVSLSSQFASRPWHALPTLYAYDFGDDWEHLLVHEGMESAETSLNYPRCLAGARRCPPEDCGGVRGYLDFLEIIANPKHFEHASMLQWAGGDYDPDAFDPEGVVFEDPRKRWKVAFQQQSHPITRGTLCAKVNDYEKRTYAADRLLRPLRRVGGKGEGGFEPISWDAALDVTATRFQQVIRQHGPAALFSFDYLGSMGVVQRRALRRIFHALGASRQTGSVCGASGNVLEAEGTPRGFDPEEFVHSQLILLWGCNLLSTSHHTFAFMQEARRRHGARLIAIDPRRTITAARCDVHLPIRPGTDHLLALALGRVLLDEDLADRSLASRAAVDLDEYRKQARVDGVFPRRAARL